jgi:hypothetical protein
MGERAKKLKAEMVLEHIVDLKTQQLFGYKFLGYETYNISLE